MHTYGVFSDNSVWLVSPIYTPLDKAISTYGIIASTISPKTGRGSLFWQEYVFTVHTSALSVHRAKK